MCVCAWMQTGSQTVVPADSSYRHQGRLNRDEQINYRLCVLLIKYKKTQSGGKIKTLKPICYNVEVLISSQIKVFVEAVT